MKYLIVIDVLNTVPFRIFEIVVGAPYYTDSYSVPSIGKVYVYSSKV